jgi:dTDP-glucose 4,6-dehydratase
MKKVLLTGSAGFIGHHIVKKLILETNYHLVCLDRLDFSGNLNRLAELKNELGDRCVDRIKIVHHDLKAEINAQLVKQIGHIDYILHIAAGSHVTRSIENPMLFVLDNVVGTCNLLEYARHHLPNLEKFINFGTDELFGNAPIGVNYKEYDRYNSRSPYSATKAGAEELCVAYENTYKMPIYCTHTMNVFGERQSPEKFIGIAMRNILENKKILIHGDEKTGTISGLRHWIHAEDVADAILFIMNLPHKQFTLAKDIADATCPKFNIVGTQEVSNLELVEKVSTILDRSFNYEIVSFDKQRPGHDFRYSLCGDYMKGLGWQPRENFDKRLEQMVKWTLHNQQWLWM